MKIILLFLLAHLIFGCTSNSEIGGEPVEQKNWFFWSVDWHPTNDHIVVGGNNDTFFKIISTADLQEMKSFPYQGTITKTKWHPTKNTIAISVQDGKSKSILFNLDAETSVELDSVSTDGARAIGWNHTGNLLAVGDYNGDLTIYDEQGNFLRRVETKQKGLIGLDWHPNENLIVAVGEKISLYQFDSDSLMHLEDREEDVLMLCTAWHPSGKFFVTGDYGNFQTNHPPLLQYWNYNGQRIKSIQESKGEYRNMKWSKDGALLATASEKIRLWNEHGELVAARNVDDLLWGIGWNREGNELITTDEKRRIVRWNKSLEKVKEIQY